MCSTSAVGIDLGTTFSAVAVFRNGFPEIIKCQGERTMPSVVFYDNNVNHHVSVGFEALEEAPKYLKNEIFDVKRIIGREYNDYYVEQLRQSGNYPFDIVEGAHGEACIEVKCGGQMLRKMPEDVSFQVLDHLKKFASLYLGEEVRDAVISVPAYFSNAQRQATKRAAELAGLVVLKFISEPVAAAVHYTYKKQASGMFLVFDFGGGTLDVSIIKLGGKKYEVKAVHGDTALGGRDIDDVLVNYFKAPMSEEEKRDERLIRRLKKNCVKLKKKISLANHENDEVQQTFFYKDEREYSLVLSREIFDHLNKDIFERALDTAKMCLLKAGLGKSQIDEILMVGGSCRNIKIYELLKDYFEGVTIRRDVDFDEAIALGASIQAAMLKSGRGELENYKITEVTPLSLGINCDGVMHVVIPRNSPIPAEAKETLYNSLNICNGADTVHMTIFEGERQRSQLNNKLGEIAISGLPNGKAGTLSFETTFSLNEDGILKVTATEKTTSQEKELTVSIGNFHLCEYQVTKNLKDALKNQQDDNIFVAFAEEKRKLRRLCNSILFDSRQIKNSEDKLLIERECEQFLTVRKSIHYHNIHELREAFRKLSKNIVPTLLKHEGVILTSDINQFLGLMGN